LSCSLINNKFQNIIKMGKLYSDIVNGRRDDISIQIAQGISLARKFGIDLKPGPGIKPDGNCWIRTVMDQMNNRFLFVINTTYIIYAFLGKHF
jgi:hypothetical protein